MQDGGTLDQNLYYTSVLIIPNSNYLRSRQLIGHGRVLGAICLLTDCLHETDFSLCHTDFVSLLCSPLKTF